MIVRRRKAAATGVVACALGLACFATLSHTSIASAYIETNQTFKSASPWGCIRHVSNVTHGGSDDAIRIRASAYPWGVVGGGTGNTQSESCDRVAGGRISGQLVQGLIKLRRLGATFDDYYYCRITSTGGLSKRDALSYEYSWSSPPCGPGYYALIACLQSVDVDWYFSGWGTFRGTRTDEDIRTQCNVSPSWHPAIDNAPAVGPAVRL